MIYDIEALQTMTHKGVDTNLSLTVTGGNKTRKITGLQTTAQRFVHLLLTPKGKVPMDDTRGTYLKKWGDSGVLTNRRFTTHYLTLAIYETQKQLNKGTVDVNERIKDASLVAFSVTDSTLYVVIKLTTDAGDSVEYKFPMR